MRKGERAGGVVMTQTGSRSWQWPVWVHKSLSGPFLPFLIPSPLPSRICCSFHTRHGPCCALPPPPPHNKHTIKHVLHALTHLQASLALVFMAPNHQVQPQRQLGLHDAIFGLVRSGVGIRRDREVWGCGEVLFCVMCDCIYMYSDSRCFHGTTWEKGCGSGCSRGDPGMAKRGSRTQPAAAGPQVYMRAELFCS